MSDQDNENWQQCWRDRDIAFHQFAVDAMLARYWAQLGLAPSDRVFVPLCGKSLDLMWLHRLGHRVTGVELSPIAVRAFFKESKLQPRRTKVGAFTRWEHDRLRIYCGDFFDLRAEDLVGVKALYDRASLTALPEDLRERYVAHLHSILPGDCVILLLTLEDLDEGESDASASAASAEITGLYQAAFDVDMQHAECFSEKTDGTPGAAANRCVRKAYILRPHPLPAAA